MSLYFSRVVLIVFELDELDHRVSVFTSIPSNSKRTNFMAINVKLPFSTYSLKNKRGLVHFGVFLFLFLLKECFLYLIPRQICSCGRKKRIDRGSSPSLAAGVEDHVFDSLVPLDQQNDKNLVCVTPHEKYDFFFLQESLFLYFFIFLLRRVLNWRSMCCGDQEDSIFFNAEYPIVGFDKAVAIFSQISERLLENPTLVCALRFQAHSEGTPQAGFFLNFLVIFNLVLVIF